MQANKTLLCEPTNNSMGFGFGLNKHKRLKDTKENDFYYSMLL